MHTHHYDSGDITKGTSAWMTSDTLHMLKAAHHYVSVDVFKTALLTECLLTHKYMGANHYVCVDVLWDCPFDWMPSYTNHKYNGVHHYVCVDVL
jgi:hypothetical protein